MTTIREELVAASAAHNLALTAGQLEAFEAYAALLAEWNARVNLTALTGAREFAERHVADSLSAWSAENFAAGASVIDVGSGAGFPGLPLKIVHDGLRVALLDSNGKRVEFLRAVVSRLKLRGVCVVHARAEDAAREPAHRERYDVAVARSVAPLNVLAEYALPFVRLGGCLVALKGAGAAEEVREATRALGLLGGGAPTMRAVHLPGDTQPGRAVVRVPKLAPTPARYPRRAGMPKKRPLSVGE